MSASSLSHTHTQIELWVNGDYLSWLIAKIFCSLELKMIFHSPTPLHVLLERNCYILIPEVERNRLYRIIKATTFGSCLLSVPCGLGWFSLSFHQASLGSCTGLHALIFWTDTICIPPCLSLLILAFIIYNMKTENTFIKQSLRWLC